MANHDHDTELSVWYHNYTPERFPTISKPNIVGYFSLDCPDGERRYHPTAECLKYLKLPTNLKNLNWNLNEGYENVIRKPINAADERIDHLLQFIMENQEKFRSNDVERLLRTDFVCFRGLLRLIMCTPYEGRDDWCILATKYKGTVYFCQQETAMKKELVAKETPQQKKFCSYGFKFEQFVLTDDPKAEPDTSPPVNEAEEWCCLFSTRLEGLDLLYGAEMDGIVSKQKVDMTKTDPNTLDLVEVKLRIKDTNSNQKRNLQRFKTRQWWCQSFLVGINRIFVGLRNDFGFVKEIEVLDMKQVRNMGKEYWSPAVCTDFLVKFLKMVKTIVAETDCPHTVFEFYWNPRGQKTITYNFHDGRNSLSFLPNWYINGLQSMEANKSVFS